MKAMRYNFGKISHSSVSSVKQRLNGLINYQRYFLGTGKLLQIINKNYMMLKLLKEGKLEKKKRKWQNNMNVVNNY